MSDVIFDDGEQVMVQCNNLNVQGHDLVLDSPARRKPNGPTFRRALVHDQNVGLTINYAWDYPGGVYLNGVTEVHPHLQPGATFGVLVVRGGISYETQGVDMQMHPRTITVFLDEELSTLRSQINDLLAKVTALQAALHV